MGVYCMKYENTILRQSRTAQQSSCVACLVDTFTQSSNDFERQFHSI